MECDGMDMMSEREFGNIKVKESAALAGCVLQCDQYQLLMDTKVEEYEESFVSVKRMITRHGRVSYWYDFDLSYHEESHSYVLAMVMKGKRMGLCIGMARMFFSFVRDYDKDLRVSDVVAEKKMREKINAFVWLTRKAMSMKFQKGYEKNEYGKAFYQSGQIMKLEFSICKEFEMDDICEENEKISETLLSSQGTTLIENYAIYTPSDIEKRGCIFHMVANAEYETNEMELIIPNNKIGYEVRKQFDVFLNMLKDNISS